jgi:hypothetical protein
VINWLLRMLFSRNTVLVHFLSERRIFISELSNESCFPKNIKGLNSTSLFSFGWFVGCGAKMAQELLKKIFAVNCLFPLNSETPAL